MEQQVARYIDLSDKAKAAVQLRACRKTDWRGYMADLEAQAASETRPRQLEALRRDWRHAQRQAVWAETGVLPAGR